jgi:hypothetical protein
MPHCVRLLPRMLDLAFLRLLRAFTRTYPHTNGYFPNLSSAVLESDACLPRCGGECGCVACNLQFVMWADEAGHLGPDEPLATEAEQLKLFRGEP